MTNPLAAASIRTNAAPIIRTLNKKGMAWGLSSCNSFLFFLAIISHAASMMFQPLNNIF